MIGFAARNFSSHGHKLIHSIEKGAMPIFIIFFALAGATLDLVVVKAMWFTALVYFIARFALMWGATTASAKWLREPEKVRKYLWGGFISQAGVSLGLAMMIRSQFPGWGAALSTLIIAEIAIAELAGPIIFKRALIASGEAGRQETSSALRPAAAARGE
jgi:Kef-type K+ transport system membrane component KefB